MSNIVGHWRTGKLLLGYFITNTNICLESSRLNILMGVIWYQEESEVFSSINVFPTSLETLRTNIIAGINEFTEVTLMIVILINNKYGIDKYWRCFS